MRPAIILVCSLLAGCAGAQRGPSPEGQAASDCMLREGPEVARTPTDLDTASYALLARCAAELNGEKQAIINRYPGYRDYIQPRLRQFDEMRLDLARQTIATMRAR